MCVIVRHKMKISHNASDRRVCGKVHHEMPAVNSGTVAMTHLLKMTTGVPLPPLLIRSQESREPLLRKEGHYCGRRRSDRSTLCKNGSSLGWLQTRLGTCINSSRHVNCCSELFEVANSFVHTRFRSSFQTESGMPYAVSMTQARFVTIWSTEG